MDATVERRGELADGRAGHEWVHVCGGCGAVGVAARHPIGAEPGCTCARDEVAGERAEVLAREGRLF